MNANDLLKNLNAPELNNPNFTDSFTQLISDINTNFKILAGAPFGVGGPGDSVVSYMEYLFVKSGNNILLTDIGYEVFKVLFPKADLTGVNVENERNERKYETIKGIINVAYPSINNIGVLNMFDDKIYTSPDGNVCEWAWCGTELIDGTHQSILPISLYQFYDQRTSGLSSVNNASFEDMTASIFATLDESGNVIYKSLSIYPKLYFDRSNNYWAWMINNEKTGINATGPQGNPGSAGSALLYNYNPLTQTGYYFYEGVQKSEDDMISAGILKEGSIRFRVINEETPEEVDPIRSELYLDAYSIIDGIGAWSEGPQLYKTLDNWLIKNYFDEIHARLVNNNSPQTLRVLGLPIFSDYYIDESPESSGIGYPTVGATITGYHSIEPRRDSISGGPRNKLHIQPIVATDLFNKLGVPNANTSIAESDIQILDYVNIYINKANDPIFANIKSDSFSILRSDLLNKYTKQTIDGIEVLDSNFKSNLSNKGLLVQLVGGYEGDIIQSNLTRHGLFVESGLESSVYRAEGIRMMNTGNSVGNTYNKISSNLLYIGTQQVGSGSFVPGDTSRGFYVTGNTGEETDKKEYRSVLYKNTTTTQGRKTHYTKKSNTSTIDSIEIKSNIQGLNPIPTIKTNTITVDSIEIKDGTKSNTSLVNSITIKDGSNTNEITLDKIKITNSVSIPGETNPKSVTAEINPYGGMLVPIGGIIMWTHSINTQQTSWMDEIPKGFIPCGYISNIETFHNDNVKPYCVKLGINCTPTYIQRENESSTADTVIIMPTYPLNGNGRYRKFNGISIPNFPVPSYPVSGMVDGVLTYDQPGEVNRVCVGGPTSNGNSYDKFLYIMRVF